MYHVALIHMKLWKKIYYCYFYRVVCCLFKCLLLYENAKSLETVITNNSHLFNPITLITANTK